MIRKQYMVVGLGLILAGMLTAGTSAGANLDFVINAQPASLLINTEDTFGVVSADGTRVTFSSIALMPNLSAGIGMDIGRFYLDLTGGAGILVTDAFQSFFLQAEVGLLYAVTDSLSVGPHGGLIQFSGPEWKADQDVTFGDGAGLIVGLQMTMGDRLMYLVSVDLISTRFDVEAGEGFVPEQDELKLSGLAVQFGVRGQF